MYIQPGFKQSSQVNNNELLASCLELSGIVHVCKLQQFTDITETNCTQHTDTHIHIQRNVHQFLHILASPGYAPGTIAVSVTWMERGFNAGQMLSSIYPSIFNHLWAIARYWSEIATFSYPPCILRPRWGVPIRIPGKSLVLRKFESLGCHAVKTVWR